MLAGQQTAWSSFQSRSPDSAPSQLCDYRHITYSSVKWAWSWYLSLYLSVIMRDYELSICKAFCRHQAMSKHYLSAW